MNSVKYIEEEGGTSTTPTHPPGFVHRVLICADEWLDYLFDWRWRREVKAAMKEEAVPYEPFSPASRARHGLDEE